MFSCSLYTSVQWFFSSPFLHAMQRHIRDKNKRWRFAAAAFGFFLTFMTVWFTVWHGTTVQTEPCLREQVQPTELNVFYKCKPKTNKGLLFQPCWTLYHFVCLCDPRFQLWLAWLCVRSYCKLCNLFNIPAHTWAALIPVSYTHLTLPTRLMV